MILRATCEDVLRKTKADVASDMPKPQAGAGKPEPAGDAGVHVTAAAAPLDGAYYMQRQYHLQEHWAGSLGLRRHDSHCLACSEPLCSAGLLRKPG